MEDKIREAIENTDKRKKYDAEAKVLLLDLLDETSVEFDINTVYVGAQRIYARGRIVNHLETIDIATYMRQGLGDFVLMWFPEKGLKLCLRSSEGDVDAVFDRNTDYLDYIEYDKFLEEYYIFLNWCTALKTFENETGAIRDMLKVLQSRGERIEPKPQNELTESPIQNPTPHPKKRADKKKPLRIEDTEKAVKDDISASRTEEKTEKL